MSALYFLSYSWYEEYDPTLLEGPEVPDWEAHCAAILPEAVRRIFESGHEGWIGWDRIQHRVLEILLERGYKVVEPPEVNFWGSCIIDGREEDRRGGLSAHDLNRIIDHNNKKKSGML